MNMENNNNDPKKVKPVKEQSMMQQFLLSLVATTISIVLTFGTATIIDKNQKKNIETFNIIGNVSFVSEVSDFYIIRNTYKERVIDKIHDEIEDVEIIASLKTVFYINFYEYAFDNFAYLEEMKEHRNKCMKIMNITEKEVEDFSKQYVNNDEKNDDYWNKINEMLNEYYEVEALIKQAREDYKDK